jgi:hypothetical protein
MPNCSTTVSSNLIALRAQARRPSQTQTVVQLGYAPALNAHGIVKVILDGISSRVEPGQLLAVLGLSGTSFLLFYIGRSEYFICRCWN